MAGDFDDATNDIEQVVEVVREVEVSDDLKCSANSSTST